MESKCIWDIYSVADGDLCTLLRSRHRGTRTVGGFSSSCGAFKLISCSTQPKQSTCSWILKLSSLVKNNHNPWRGLILTVAKNSILFVLNLWQPLLHIKYIGVTSLSNGEYFTVEGNSTLGLYLFLLVLLLSALSRVCFSKVMLFC